MCRYFNLLFISFLFSIFLASCSVFKSTQSGPESSAVPVAPAAEKGELKPYSEVITEEAETAEGLFTVHNIKENYYYEIPDSLLGREMLTVSRISRAAEGVMHGGMKNNTQVFRWERRNDNILLRRVSFSNTAVDSLPVYEAVRNSNFEPIIASFNIEALNEDTTGTVIDVTPLFTTDIPALGLLPMMRQIYQVRRLDGSRTFIESIRTFPENIEARHIVTYDAGTPPSNSDTNTISLEINHSMILLPETPVQPRKPDARVGYFTANQVDYGSEEYRAKPVSHITRWQLVPKDPDAYLNGKLVEPEEPIVFYIDPATPKQWRKWLILGVNDWQETFEEAGFKNAIYGKMAPTPKEDPDFSLEDIRYPTIRYYASSIQNAFGPHVHDPRSGQIVGSSIGWFHNITRLLRNWYFVQTAAANPNARSAQFEEDLMGELVRFVAAHEVGHTLGLTHNMGANHAIPVDSLRSPTYTADNGTSASIMDYARFNYIAQPGDGVTQFFPGMGEYDKWAIKWGYTWFGDMPVEEQEKILHKWTTELADDQAYFYGRPGSTTDPRSQVEALGDNNMKAGELGLANLEVITENMIDWIGDEGEDFYELNELYNQILAQWSRYMGHVIQNIGGIFETHKTYDQDGIVFEGVPAEQQKEAMKFLADHAFADPPVWMLNSDILGRVNQSGIIEGIRSRQTSALNNLVDPQRIARLIEYDHRSNKTYSPYQFMDDVREIVWSELKDNSLSISVYRRNLQRAWVERMDYLMTQPIQYSFFSENINISQSDMRPMTREQLETVLSDVQKTKPSVEDRSTRIHLNDIEHRIEAILNPE